MARTNLNPTLAILPCSHLSLRMRRKSHLPLWQSDYSDQAATILLLVMWQSGSCPLEATVGQFLLTHYMDHQQGHGMSAAVCDIASGHSMLKTRTTAIGISSFSETLFCCLLCDNSIKIILFILFIVFSLFLWCQCCSLVMIIEMQPNPLR